ncbi:crosslink repair DNA glycosylase YcaQ family protein [Micromonospora sp. C28SCA-DRY-2]|uniref:DNA glycosylase AlkZ-like family protein n=1 Tax=Micromonospora sp. C28SCA-DRY-2 TaxID=3059522 RepID=UPI002674DF39|nr:crosslink repair DNA glycosylase YcaQ family protein [Micromonospora sp. C28SCA-DRY-2]MDO3702129.1 crosslink repair DNA glycosylase YcaQ family protein [Micromonospora sp. C28SCA-DRY-2]
MARGGTEVSREQVLAYRAAAQELHRPGRAAADLAVLDLGVQDTPYGSARLALAARGAPTGDDRLELVWSMRGAPHLHRRAELPELAAAIWPLDDADATRRLPGRIREGARLGLAAFRVTADAFAAVVTAPMARGDVSRAVSDRVPAELTYDCEPCGARHISGALFQQAGLAGGVRLAVSGRSATLAPLSGWTGPPERAAGTDALVLAYLRLLGPATPAEVAGFLGTSAGALRGVWPEGLAEVRVAGRRAWLPADRLDALREARPAPGVRLLPPGDPFLQARDRDALVPEKAHQKQLWRIIGNPGALLVDGEVAGVWRAKVAGRGALEVTVTPFDGRALPGRARRELEAEAAVVAAARGATEVRVGVEPA